jgi:hypothetical protein
MVTTKTRQWAVLLTGAVLATALPQGLWAQVAPLGGTLAVQPTANRVEAGTKIAVKLGLEANPTGGDFTNRQAKFYLFRQRWNLFEDPLYELKATGSGANWTVEIPAVTPGWYVLVSQVNDDTGTLDNLGKAAESAQDKRFIARAILPVVDRKVALYANLSTERGRCVFSPGEIVRFYTTLKGVAATRGTLTWTLQPQTPLAQPVTLGTQTVNLTAGQEQTIIYDIPAATSAALLPARYQITLSLDGKVMDRFPVEWVSGQRPGAGARVYNGGPWGGDSSQPLDPWDLPRSSGWLDKEMVRGHNANGWINIFSSGPQMGPSQNWRTAQQDADLPPVGGEYRPGTMQAHYQALMARGANAIIMMGGAELGSENYMPVPTTPGAAMDLMARKYLVGAMSFAYLPNFTGVYTDAYAKPDWHGGEEFTDAEEAEVRAKVWELGWKHAGLGNVAPASDFGDDRTPIDFSKAVGTPALDGGKRKIFSEYVQKVIQDEYKGEVGLLYKAPVSQKQKVWNGAWSAVGVTPAPQAKPRYPMPRPNLDTMPADAQYKFTEYVQSGFGRYYGSLTRAIESQMPAVYTIHNRRRENHRQAGYAWGDWSRSASVPPEYSFGGPTVLYSSEFNLDAEPQPYSMPTMYLQSNVDKGQPAWASAVGFQFTGSTGRLLRDAVFFLGRGVTPIYHNPQGFSWALRGSDQGAYASYDRLHSVNAFANQFEGLFTQLQAVKEVAYYSGPHWAGPNEIGAYVAFPAALMTGHQVHMLSHADAAKGGFDPYKVIFAPAQPVPPEQSFIKDAFTGYTKRGGTIITTPAPLRYCEPYTDLTKLGIVKQEVKQTDSKGRVTTKQEYQATPVQEQQATVEAMWKDYRASVQVVPIDIMKQWAYIDPETNQREAYGRRSHWTGHHTWANAGVAALDVYDDLKTAFDKVNDPLVKKDKPEVFVSAMRPRDAKAQGTFLFAANFTIPKDKAWTDLRIPWFLWPNTADAVNCQLQIKDTNVGAVYDLMTARPVPFTRAGGRIVFQADLSAVEGRVFALYPAPVAGATLSLPAQVNAGESVRGRFELKTAEGNVLTVAGAVRLTLRTAEGTILQQVYRHLPADGTLPALRVPGNAGNCTYEVLDLITGQQATAPLTITTPTLTANLAAPVTVFEGDRIHEWLKAGSGKIRIVIESGEMAIVQRPDPVAKAKADAEKSEHDAREKAKEDAAKKANKKYDAKPFNYPKLENVEVQEVKTANPRLAEDRKVADALATALNTAGIKVTVCESKDVSAGPLWGYPYHGSRANYRGRFTVPSVAIDGPVLLVGSPANSQFLQQMDQANVVGRELSNEQLAGGRAVVAFLPRAFSSSADSVAVAANSAEGFTLAVQNLTALAKTNPGPDPFYQAREAARREWLTLDIARYKQQMGVLPTEAVPAPPVTRTIAAHKSNYRGMEADLGPAIYALNASANGVAVSTKSLGRGVVLVGADGKVKMSTGGGAEVMAKDVAVSADGNNLMAGFALHGVVSAFNSTGQRLWTNRAGIVRKDDPFAWDTYKPAESYLGGSPDNTIVVSSGGPAGFIARDSNTQKELWRITGYVSPDRPEGEPAREVVFSRDGKYVLISKLEKLDAGATDDNKNPVTNVQTKNNMLLVEARTGKVVWTAPADVSDWELVNTVGPEGDWTITAGRTPTFTVRGVRGQTLRVFTPLQLPAELNQGWLLAPQFLASQTNPNRIVVYTPQANCAFVYDLKIGSNADTTAAEKAQQEADAAVTQLETILKDTKRLREFTPASVDQIMSDLKFSPQVVAVIAPRMKQVPGEFRGGRPRNFSYFTEQLKDLRLIQFNQIKPLLERACQLELLRQLDVPDMINHSVLSPDGQTLYVSLWNHTVAAYDVKSGQARWTTPVAGGCQLSLVGADTLYAGGSRGDLYRLDSASGKIVWQVNLVGYTSVAAGQ